jgi:hypothetical protein
MASEHVTEILDHKILVSKYMSIIINEMLRRAIEHDNSKFSPEEFDSFERVVPRLRHLAYGSHEYKQALKEIDPAIQHHYKVNQHHPEYFENGVNGMNLIDLVEMVCDWIAASQKGKDGDIRMSLEINKERFGISEQLFLVISNTITMVTSGQVEICS